MQTHERSFPEQRVPRVKLGGSAKIFLLFAIYTVIPLFEIPIIGLSLSAPLFYFLVLEIISVRNRKKRVRLGSFPALAFICLVGIIFSLLWQGISSHGDNLGRAEVVALIRQTTWILVFVVTLYYLVQKKELMPILARAIGWAVTVLALLRWYEVFVYGKIGAWVNTVFMTQNSYGILFASNMPFLIAGMFDRRGSSRKSSLFFFLIVAGALVVNGSRTSWVSTALGTVLCLVIYVLAFPGKSKLFMRLIIVLGLVAGTGAMFFRFAPESVTKTFEDRLATMQDLEMDKSYQFRKVMIQKGIKIFQQNPITGCGLGRFKNTTIEDLEMPYILKSADFYSFEKKSSHNSYVQMLAETGLLGTIPFAILILILFFQGFKASIQLVSEREFWAVGVYVSFVSMSIYLWTLAGLTTTSTWLKYGMVAALIMIARFYSNRNFSAETRRGLPLNPEAAREEGSR